MTLPLGQDPRHRNRHVGLTCGIFDPQHAKAIGGALWLFVWCVRRDLDGNGDVLGGSWVPMSQIATESGLTIEAVRWQLERLESGGYIEARRARGHGVRIRVNEQKKRGLTERYGVQPQSENTTETETEVKSVTSGLLRGPTPEPVRYGVQPQSATGSNPRALRGPTPEPSITRERERDEGGWWDIVNIVAEESGINLMGFDSLFRSEDPKLFDVLLNYDQRTWRHIARELASLPPDQRRRKLRGHKGFLLRDLVGLGAGAGPDIGSLSGKALERAEAEQLLFGSGSIRPAEKRTETGQISPASKNRATGLG